MRRVLPGLLVAASAALLLSGGLSAQNAQPQGGGRGGGANQGPAGGAAGGAPDDGGWEQRTAAARKKAAEKTPIPRGPDGHPNFTGTFNPPGGNVNQFVLLEEHPGGFGVSAGPSLIADPPDGKIPYTAAALAERDRRKRPENHWEDNRYKCILMGNPREMLFGTRMYQSPDLFFRYGEREGLVVTRFATKHELSNSIQLWMGDSIASWDGDTLVIDTTNLNGKFWLVIGGDYLSDAAHIVERFTFINHDTLDWQATITDPKTFTRPWTMKFPGPWVRGEGNPAGGGGAAFDADNACHEGNVDAVHYYNYNKQVKTGKSAGE